MHSTQCLQTLNVGCSKMGCSGSTLSSMLPKYSNGLFRLYSLFELIPRMIFLSFRHIIFPIHHSHSSPFSDFSTCITSAIPPSLQSSTICTVISINRGLIWDFNTYVHDVDWLPVALCFFTNTSSPICHSSAKSLYPTLWLTSLLPLPTYHPSAHLP